VYICHCRSVTDRHICAAIEAGARDAAAVTRGCGAGGGCGGCVPALRALLAQYGLAGEPEAPRADSYAA
jgi:bacterioferritin-associated ferredoxin